MRKQSFPTSLEFFKFKALYNYSPELPLFPDLRYRSYKIFRKICEKKMKQKSQAFAASSYSKCLVLICAPQGRPRFYFYFAQRSFTTSPAIISPTTDGTNATLPGISLLSVHLCSAPGGQIQWFLQLIAMSSIGLVGFSSE